MKFISTQTEFGLFMMLRSLILVLAILPSFAAENIKAVGAVSKANIKAVGAVAEANIKAVGAVDNTGGGAPSYLFQENFDGTGAGTWSGTADYDYTSSPAPLEGTQSLRLQEESVYNQDAFTGVTEVWMYFMWHPVNHVSTHSIGGLWDGGLSGVAEIRADTGDNTIFVVCGTATSAKTVATWAEGVTYHVWLRYKVGSGANAEVDVWFNTSATHPGAGNNKTGLTNGSKTTNATTPFFNTNFGGVDMIFDKLRVDDVAIGSNPS